ncbi:hypothetical protein HanRHA438_Chr03g0126821 [Helianthus annuus]|nr:hypothetical protein HanRHA438_Chr03g0126821 [Helianthus annuus]
MDLFSCIFVCNKMDLGSMDTWLFDMERHNKRPKGGSHLSDVIVTGWERSRGVLGYGYG